MTSHPQYTAVPAYGQTVMPERKEQPPTEQVESSVAFSVVLSALGMPHAVSHMLEAGHAVHSGLEEANQAGQGMAPNQAIDPVGAIMPDAEFMPSNRRLRPE